MSQDQAVESIEEPTNYDQHWKEMEAAVDAEEAVESVEETPTESVPEESAPEEPETPDAPVEETDDEPVATEEEAPSEEEPEEDREPPPEPQEAEDEILEKLKAKGYEIHNRKVVSAERAKLWKKREKLLAEVDQERAQAAAEIERHTSTLEEKYRRAIDLQKAMDSDDLDGVASAFGHKDWNELNQHALKQRLSPEHKRVMALQKELEQRKQAELKAQEKYQQEQQARLRQQKEREQLDNLADDLADMKVPHFQTLAKDPSFVAGTLNHLRNNWDGHETIPVQEAANLAYLDAKKLYEKLHTHFGGGARNAASEPTSGSTAEIPATGGTDGKRRKPPKTISQTQVAEASAPQEFDPDDDDAWLAYHTKQLADSG
jgi:hypothetical protein